MEVLLTAYGPYNLGYSLDSKPGGLLSKRGSLRRTSPLEIHYCKTPNFREHLIFAQIHEGVGQGGLGRHRQLKMTITSLIMARFSKFKNWIAAGDRQIGPNWSKWRIRDILDSRK